MDNLRPWFLLPVAALLLLLFLPAQLPAHGTGIDLLKESAARSIYCYYSSGDPMAYAEILVYAPSDSTMEYQNGRTDRSGHFAFVPDRGGTWRIVVNDGQGHRCETSVTVGTKPHADKSSREASASVASPQKAGSTMTSLGAICGLSLIFNFFGIVSILRDKYHALLGNKGVGIL